MLDGQLMETNRFTDRLAVELRGLASSSSPWGRNVRREGKNH